MPAAAAPPYGQPAAPQARPTKDGYLGFRVDDDILALLDARAEQLREERPGTNVTRSDVAREILYRALREGAKTGK